MNVPPCGSGLKPNGSRRTGLDDGLGGVHTVPPGDFIPSQGVPRAAERT
jgi:hypothetical protein